MNKEDNTYNKLIEAGVKLFGRDDFSKVSTRDLTKEAGACLGALFYHFGSKEKLYIKVVEYLTTEAASKFTRIDINNFQKLDVDGMRQEITRMIYSFNDLFVSGHGISCNNIINREAIPGNNSEVGKILHQFAQMFRANLSKIFMVYYTSIGLPVDNVEFIITLMFSLLKNHLIRDGEFYNVVNYEEDILKKLIDLVLYQKLYVE
jgi:AcrR family transcriptional regulator